MSDGTLYKVTRTVYGSESSEQVWERLQNEDPNLAQRIRELSQIDIKDDIAYRYRLEDRRAVFRDLLDVYSLLEAQAEVNELEKKLG